METLNLTIEERIEKLQNKFNEFAIKCDDSEAIYMVNALAGVKNLVRSFKGDKNLTSLIEMVVRIDEISEEMSYWLFNEQLNQTYDRAVAEAKKFVEESLSLKEMTRFLKYYKENKGIRTYGFDVIRKIIFSEINSTLDECND